MFSWTGCTLEWRMSSRQREYSLPNHTVEHTKSYHPTNIQSKIQSQAPSIVQESTIKGAVNLITEQSLSINYDWFSAYSLMCFDHPNNPRTLSTSIKKGKNEYNSYYIGFDLKKIRLDFFPIKISLESQVPLNWDILVRSAEAGLLSPGKELQLLDHKGLDFFSTYNSAEMFTQGERILSSNRRLRRIPTAVLSGNSLLFVVPFHYISLCSALWLTGRNLPFQTARLPQNCWLQNTSCCPASDRTKHCNKEQISSLTFSHFSLPYLSTVLLELLWL